MDPIKQAQLLTKANLLIHFFYSVFNSHSDTLSSRTFPTSSQCSVNIFLQDTFNALSSLDCYKTMGGDCIPLFILKHSAAALTKPIHRLFTLCISQSYLQLHWCSHYISPIPKTGDKSSISNYRPISLLCILSKVLEKIVFNKIYEFALRTSILLLQFGFVKKRSSLQQLLLYTEILARLYGNCHQVESVYLDLHKAFDSVHITTDYY